MKILTSIKEEELESPPKLFQVDKHQYSLVIYESQKMKIRRAHDHQGAVQVKS